MKKKYKKIKTWIWISLISIALIVGIIVGAKIFDEKSNQNIYTGQYKSFMINSINVLADSSPDNFCYSRAFSNDISFSYYICFPSLSASSGCATSYCVDIACNCFETNQEIRK